MRLDTWTTVNGVCFVLASSMVAGIAMPKIRAVMLRQVQIAELRAEREAWVVNAAKQVQPARASTRTSQVGFDQGILEDLRRASAIRRATKNLHEIGRSREEIMQLVRKHAPLTEGSAREFEAELDKQIAELVKLEVAQPVQESWYGVRPVSPYGIFPFIFEPDKADPPGGPVY